MPRQATKACGNMLYESRMRAGRYNEKFLTRSGAAEALPGVTEDALKKYELGINTAPNIVIALMADAYNDPGLISQYCSEACPLGGNCRKIDEMPVERALIRLQNYLPEVNSAIKELEEIMDDGKITADELEQLPEAMEAILEFRRRADENLAALKKIINSQGNK